MSATVHNIRDAARKRGGKLLLYETIIAELNVQLAHARFRRDACRTIATTTRALSDALFECKQRLARISHTMDR
jgi:hypothetical protein